MEILIWFSLRDLVSSVTTSSEDKVGFSETRLSLTEGPTCYDKRCRRSHIFSECRELRVFCVETFKQPSVRCSPSPVTGKAAAVTSLMKVWPEVRHVRKFQYIKSTEASVLGPVCFTINCPLGDF